MHLKDTATILQSIVMQLSYFNSDTLIMDSVMRLHEQKRGRGSLNETECVKTIIELTNHYPMTTIVIDALDEYENVDVRRSLIVCLQKILEESKSLVKIFVSSRNLTDIETLMNTKSPMLLSVEVRDNDNKEDIRRFVEEKLADYIQTRDLLDGNVPDDLKEEIITKLTHGAQGM